MQPLQFGPAISSLCQDESRFPNPDTKPMEPLSFSKIRGGLVLWPRGFIDLVGVCIFVDLQLKKIFIYHSLPLLVISQ